MERIDLLLQCAGFEWDEGNIQKSFDKHNVTPAESEQIFFNKPLLVTSDAKHSKSEIRYYALGVTDAKRCLFTVFTIRNCFIRIISSRDMSRKERKIYERQNDKKDS